MAVTPNLGLHQWQAGDTFLRTDFNEDFGKIDAGVAQAKVASAGVHGSYVGTGEANRDIAVGFRPSCVLIAGGCTGYSGFGCIMPSVAVIASQGIVLNRKPDGTDGIPITDTGFRLKNPLNFNEQNSTCHYFAMR